MSNRVLVISEDPVGAEMGGNAIRAYELARALASHADVTLAAPTSAGDADLAVERMPFDREDTRGLRLLLRGVDVVVSLPQNPVVAALLRRSQARIVYDLYDPKPLQMLEAFASASPVRRRYHSRLALDHVLGALSDGDYLLCASERQRDLWIGAMLAAGLITPAEYRADPTLRARIDVVPFGVPSDPPLAGTDGPHRRFAALSQSAEIVLWNGGLWNWLDPLGAVEAIAQVVETRPHARLVFMGRPPLDERQRVAAETARARAIALGLLDRVVFFNDAWVPYDQRASWLLAADCALSLHLDHLETRFAFRTRLLDCFWAGVPIVCSRGDELAELVERDGLGASVAPRDSTAAAAAIVAVLERGRGAYRVALAQAAEDHSWATAAAPLIRCVHDSAAVPRRRASPVRLDARTARALATRVLRGARRVLTARAVR
jgi:glycosyltransferase involved in cell wall biosynthesis